MATNFEQRTNEFIELFYEGEGKAPTYLSKQLSELRKSIRNWTPGVKKTATQKTYEMWSGLNAAPPMAIPEVPIVPQISIGKTGGSRTVKTLLKIPMNLI
jgi:hypothetical protein